MLGSSLVEAGIFGLDQIGTLLRDHVHDVLNSTVRNDWEDGGVDDTQVLNAVHLEGQVYDPLLDIL